MERALLVTIDFGLDNHWTLTDEQHEFAMLAASSGVEIADQVVVRRHAPTPAHLIGRGKAEEIALLAQQRDADAVIFNQELSPAQQRNLEAMFERKTIDRTQLILDIFAQRAKSQEGKVQVEIAQLRYLLPRLTGKGIELSQLGGGIGTRGPGEKKLEIDRRRIRRRLDGLRDELQALARRRQATRSQRHEHRVPVAALVGYTNAGKTTLLSALTGAAALARNQLFTTLDPLTRRLKLPARHDILVSDTVGFIHHLPHHLVEAFRSTLEEAVEASLLLHVIDAGHPRAVEQAYAVREVLAGLAIEERPTWLIFNQIDRLASPQALGLLQAELGKGYAISALRGDGLDVLKTALVTHTWNPAIPPPVCQPKWAGEQCPGK